jgi:F0F1-type ATP synthase membrane subunit b/b'
MTPPNLSLLLIMICFWLTMWLVYRFLIRPIGAVLADRQGRIDTAANSWQSTHDEYLSATDRLELEMQEAARAAARVRADFRQRAQDERQKALDEARASADHQLRVALDELDGDASAARTELRGRADTLAALFATQLLGRKVSS